MLQNQSKETSVMETNSIRRSDRLALELPLQLSGTDCTGQGYIEQGSTQLLSRHGAKVVLNRKLLPNQELSLRCLSTGLAAEARVVGQVGRGPQGYFYGVEFLDFYANPWKIDFPPPAEFRQSVARAFLECARCKSRAVTYLSEIEAEIFEANRCLSRNCKTCNAMGLWTEPDSLPAHKPVSERNSPEEHLQATLARWMNSMNERKEAKPNLRMAACVRSPEFGEDVMTTEEVSPTGFRFKSPKRYTRNSIIEIAVPYSRKPGNVFVLAQIEWDRALPNEGVTLYGACYVQMQGSTIQRIEAKP
ncbi:MAG TPA: PilZ domain-containing protein [Terriglobia bacterium]|nr:PilZ domain-containing protein [Terriglobia bacterium]